MIQLVGADRKLTQRGFVLDSGAAVYLTGPPAFANATEPDVVAGRLYGPSLLRPRHFSRDLSYAYPLAAAPSPRVDILPRKFLGQLNCHGPC